MSFSSAPKYLELRIDVFDQSNQRAQVLEDLKPQDLVGAILREFRELDYLGTDPGNYLLQKARDGSQLDPDLPLKAQVRGGERLVLVEDTASLPEGTVRPSQAIYLQELTYLEDQEDQRSFKIGWVPAIIGRVDLHLSQNERVAVDLSSQVRGMRVSRRHALLTEDRGEFYLTALGTNPVSLLQGGQVLPVSSGPNRQVLQPGDIIRLDRSGIQLKFIVRQELAGG